MHRSKNEEPTSERKLARLAVARSAPPWAVTLCTRHKKGADLRCVMAGADPEGYRYAAARIMPSSC